jgi:predicted CXXCH cytochrome family protein
MGRATRNGHQRTHSYKPTRVLGLLSILGSAAVLCSSLMVDGADRGQPTSAGLSSQSCLSCHHTDPLFSHPIDVPVPQAMRSHSGDLPLVDGRMACITCHQNVGPDHAGTPRSATAAGGGRASSLLRNSLSTEQLCIRCHTTGVNTGVHGAGIAKAHFAWSDRPSRELVTDIDSESASCLGCHDGTMAKAVPARPVHGEDPLGNSHPIGTASPGVRNRPLTNTPRDPRIRLFDNTVGCGSCHSPYSRHEGLLVTSNDRSSLCLTCHADMR